MNSFTGSLPPQKETPPPHEITLEDLSELLTEQDQDRHTLSEKIIINRVNYRDSLLEDRKVKDVRIQVLEQELTVVVRPEPVRCLHSSYSDIHIR